MIETCLATVTNVSDPAKGGAIKVALTAIGGDEYPEWIEPIHPHGVLSHPVVGDTVELVMPEGDDITEFASEVRYLGVVTSEEGYPTEFAKNYPHRRGVKTPGGHLLLFDDKEKTIALTTPLQHALLLDETTQKVSLRYKNKLLISLTPQGIFLGSESASEPFVLGNLWKTMMDTILDALAVHGHPSFGAPPSNAATFIAEKAKTSATISDFIKGQKTSPV